MAALDVFEHIGPGGIECGIRCAIDPLALEQSEEALAGCIVDLHVLVDAQGNLARQIDHEGLRYRFSGSNATWVLVVS